MRSLLCAILLGFCILPFQAHAESICEESTFSCTCTDPGGTLFSVDDSEKKVNTASACKQACINEVGVTWKFYCGSTQTPTDEGENTTKEILAVHATAEGEIVKGDAQIPALNVQIPGLDLSDSVEISEDKGNITVNMIGLYVNAVFRYGLVIATIFAVLMLTIGGFQYMTAGGSKSAVTKAKARIENTLIGLALLMATYAIAFFIDPRTTWFRGLSLIQVKEIPEENVVEYGEGIVPSTTTTFYKGNGGWQDCMLSTFGGSKEELEKNLVSVTFKGKSYKVHKLVAEDFQKAFSEIEALNLSYAFSGIGTYNWRANRNNASVLSFHSWGVAIDINPSTNPNCGNKTCSYDMPLGVITAFKKNGFGWGGDWKKGKDYMHFSTKKFCGGSR